MNVYINKEKTFQTFEGFGASGAWWAQEVGGWEHKDAESNLAVRDRISQLLYSKTEGIGLRTYRYNIGGGSKQSGNGKIDNPLRRTDSFETADGRYDFDRDKNAGLIYSIASCYIHLLIIFDMSSFIQMDLCRISVGQTACPLLTQA